MGDGTRSTQSGRRRDYRRRPSGYPVHKFAVVISALDEPVVARTSAPACPVHGSAAAIGRWGSYAVRPGEVRRQRYRRVPTEPGERGELRKGCHYFTPTMARGHVDFGQLHCGECGETRGVHHGEQVVARAQSWPLRVAAEGLSRIAAGESYSAVGRWAWEVTGRTRTRPAKLSAAERSRRQAVAQWRRTLPRRRKGDREPTPPAGLSLEQLPSAENYRRRRRIYTAGNVLPPRRTPSPSAARLQKAARMYFRTAVFVPSLWHVKNAVTQALMKKSGPGAVRYTDLGLALHPRLGNLLDDLSAERLRARGVAGWKAWWDDLDTAMTELDLSTTAVRERRASYEPAVTRALPTLAANPAVPVSTGGFEMVLRARASALIAGRSHALANLERCASLFDLCVCRDQGEFHSLPAVIKALSTDNDDRGG